MDRKARLRVVVARVVVSFLAASCSVSSLNITSSPQLGVDTVCDNQDVTLMCHTNQTTGNITWYWSNQSQHGETIIAVARLTERVYTCVVANSGDELGEANVTVRANGAPPRVERNDFSNYIRKDERSNLTLTTNISSNIPLSGGYPIWIKDFSLPLSSTAVVDNYTTDGVRYSRLSLYELSFEDDTGNYTNTVKNQCGSSFVYIYIDVRKVNCDNLTDPNNGKFSCSLGYDGVPSYKDTCNFTCNTGYELTGSDTRTCRSNGGWSGTQTMCRRIYCVNLTNPDNGAKNCLLGDDGVFSYEDTCNFTCNTGYELTGSDTRICQSDGSWSGTQTMCSRRNGNANRQQSEIIGSSVGGGIAGIAGILLVILIVAVVCYKLSSNHLLLHCGDQRDSNTSLHTDNPGYDSDSNNSSNSVDQGDGNNGHFKGSADPPDLKDLNIYVQKIGKKWFDLGVQLLDKGGSDKLNVIKNNNPRDIETCCTEMFIYWTKSKTDASWKTLIAALKTIGFAGLADEIKRKHCK